MTKTKIKNKIIKEMLNNRLALLVSEGYDSLLKKLDTYWTENLTIEQVETGQIEIQIFYDDPSTNTDLRVVISYDGNTFWGAMFPISIDDIVKAPPSEE